MVPFLCLELNCLPSQIKNEDYNDVMNMVAVINHRNIRQKELEEAEKRKSKRI